MEINVTFTLQVSEEVANQIQSGELDALDVASGLSHSISSPYISGYHQVNEYEVVG